LEKARSVTNNWQAASDESGAKNPLLESGEKSRKGEGVPATAKIHGTVDSARSTKGKKPANQEKEDDDDKEEEDASKEE
jgi:hypothetical protein